jgi:hypothetical protein
MAKPKKATRKPSVKVNDLSSKKDPSGGRKAGKGQQDFMTVKLEDVLVSSYSLDKTSPSKSIAPGYDLAKNAKI